MAEGPLRLAGRAISKSFGPVQVFFDIDFALEAGKVHALIGENGAGKSTLMKILCGYQPPSSGEVLVDGQPHRFSGGADAEARGIVMIHQEFNLAEELSVEANIFIGREPRRGPFLDVAEVVTAPADELDVDEMARLMVGRDVSDLFPAKLALTSSEIVLDVQRFSVPGSIETASLIKVLASQFAN